MKMILLVEDTTLLSEEIADILRLEGYLMMSAKNAAQSLEFLSGFTPDLIITDLSMPKRDGFKLITRVRSTDSLKSIPIIILSAMTSEADKKRGKELGADAFIVKPCKTYELVASINSLLNAQVSF